MNRPFLIFTLLITSANLFSQTKHTVHAGNMYFNPAELTINQGDSVEFINDDGYHDVLITSGPEILSLPACSGPCDIGILVFNTVGEYDYECSIGSHSSMGMIGTISVSENDQDHLVLESFDEELSEDFWVFDNNPNAIEENSYITTSYTNFEDENSLKLNYMVHDTESWGGFSRITRNHPTDVFDWSNYNTLSIDYYNSVPPSLEGRIDLRIILTDSDDELYYSFHSIIDNISSGWQTLDIPLIRNDSWSGHGFNLTLWDGNLEGDGLLNLAEIKNYRIEFSMNGTGQGDITSGEIHIDEIRLGNMVHRYPVTFQFDARYLDVHPNGIHLAGGFNYIDQNHDNPEYPNWDPAG
ncbi:MAG: plastocyanin/azurin family copper-binding protein, partial [Candidatus Neomarinimicrobiota bacterium]